MGLLALLLALLLGVLLVLGRTSSGGGPATPAPLSPPATAAVAPTALLPIDRIEVRILESDPVQVQAVVSGHLADSCTQLGQIAQSRAGNAITLTIAVTRPADALCAQVLTPIQETIPLTGPFPPGDYTVTVNGVTQPFHV